jgi:hypothetical protein
MPSGANCAGAPLVDDAIPHDAAASRVTCVAAYVTSIAFDGAKVQCSVCRGDERAFLTG